jgi:D-alanyl-lipoteichoic acid acyltransferase DltB (MBOAT superfamily)
LEKEKKKAIIVIGVVLTLIPLLGYKYLHFLLTDILLLSHTDWCHWILPVGISFFTFQALTYTIDYYRGKVTEKAEILDYALFVSFFPTILSGPIERSRTLLPQLMQLSRFNMALLLNGVELFLWGLFKKIVIADRISVFVTGLYAEPHIYSGNSYMLAIAIYSIQIYCDFSGYSDMAIGVGRMLGFNLRKNFDYPYFSTSIKSFWRKWHISLTSWFTEYLYIACGGNRVAKWRWYLNIGLVFVVSGIWHGAAWTFVIWGMMHALLYLIEHVMNQSQPNCKNWAETVVRGMAVFVMVSLAWVFFRADSFYHAMDIIGSCKEPWGGWFKNGSSMSFAVLIMSISLFGMLDLLCYNRIVKLTEATDSPYRWANIIFVVFIALYTSLFGISGIKFVYFQF